MPSTSVSLLLLEIVQLSLMNTTSRRPPVLPRRRVQRSTGRGPLPDPPPEAKNRQNRDGIPSVEHRRHLHCSGEHLSPCHAVVSARGGRRRRRRQFLVRDILRCRIGNVGLPAKKKKKKKRNFR